MVQQYLIKRNASAFVNLRRKCESFFISIFFKQKKAALDHHFSAKIS